MQPESPEIQAREAMRHINLRLMAVPYTEEERKKVNALNEREERAIADWCREPESGKTFSLTKLRRDIAIERRDISRAARKRHMKTMKREEMKT